LQFKKAFATVGHIILFKKLAKISVCNSSFKWFESYLSNQYQYISIGASAKNLLLTKTGVPEGLSLGPLLFKIYTNVLPNRSKLTNFLFANNIKFVACHKDQNYLFEFVKRTLSQDFQQSVFFSLKPLSWAPDYGAEAFLNIN
jgi:hypothetical protein